MLKNNKKKQKNFRNVLFDAKFAEKIRGLHFIRPT